MNEMDLSAVAYEFAPNGLDISFLNLENRTIPALLDVVTFDPFSLPYNFAIAAYYDTGEETEDQVWLLSSGQAFSQGCFSLQMPYTMNKMA